MNTVSFLLYSVVLAFSLASASDIASEFRIKVGDILEK